MAVGELAGTTITFSISPLCCKAWKGQQRKITGASLLFANPRAAGLKMHLAPVRASCESPAQPRQQLHRELGHFQVGKGAVLVLCVCFPPGSSKVAFVRMGWCLHGLIPAGRALGDAGDEADGRNSRLHLEQQLRLQMEQECVAAGAAVAQDTQRQHPLMEL